LLFVSLVSINFYKRHFKKIIVAIFLLVALAFVLKPATLTHQLQSLPQEMFQKTRTVSGTFRVTALQSALHMTQQYPLLGVGPGVFGEAFYSYQTVPWLYGRHAHNHYMQMASETGIVGLILYLSLFIILFFVFWKKRKSFSGKKSVLLLGVMTAITASSLHAFMDFDWSITPLYALFWIFVSLFLSQVNLEHVTIKIIGKWKLLYIPPILFLFFVLVITMSGKFYTNATDDLLDKDFTQAGDDIDKSIRFNPFDAQTYLLKSDILTRKNDITRAKSMYEKSLSLSRLNAEPYYQLGLFALQEKKYASAETYFSKAIATNPYSHPKLYDGLANTYSAEKEYTKAETVLTEAIENAFPLNQSYKDFSYIYTAIGFQFDLATTYTELANVKLKLGKEKEADIIFTRMKRDLLKITPTPQK
jgi:Flp pilus assembly protein TadD